MRRFSLAALSLLCVAVIAPAAAAAPKVATDIAPVHGLAARVMAGVGAPSQILPTRASPHAYQMRPSEAKALSAADVVIWIGPELTPWLAKSIKALAPDAVSLPLLGVEGAVRLPMRGDHRDHDHGHDHDKHGEKHDDDRKDGKDKHAFTDPHAWLDPANAKVWLWAIAEALAAADQTNATAYRRNAAAAVADLDGLAREIDTRLTPLRDEPYLVLHDAYQYFERRFGLANVGAISPGDAVAPGPRRLSELRHRMHDDEPRCVFAEPQFPQKLVDAVARGHDLKVATIDPLGAGLEPGPDFYGALLRNMAAALAGCLE